MTSRRTIAARTNAAFADAFLDELRVARRLSLNTIESYGRDLTVLLDFADGGSKRLQSLSRTDLEAFVRELMASGLSPRSVARRVACVRGLFKFLVRDGHLERNPADDLRAPRAWPALPKFLSCDEVDRLIDQPDVSSPIGLRDRALIELLYRDRHASVGTGVGAPERP